MDGPLAVGVERERVNWAEMASDCAELMLIDLAEETDLKLSGFVASSRHLETFMHDRAPSMVQPDPRALTVDGTPPLCLDRFWALPSLRTDGAVCFSVHGAVQYVCTVVCARLCAEREESDSAPARPLDHRRARCGA